MKDYKVWEPTILRWSAHGIAYEKVEGMTELGTVTARDMKDAFATCKAEGIPYPILTEVRDEHRA